MLLDFRLPYGPMKDALRTILGGTVALLLTSMFAGCMLATIVEWNDVEGNGGPLIYFLFAWFVHWMVAIISVWGGVFLVIHVTVFYSLLYGSRDPRFLLMLAFGNQLCVSTGALILADSYQAERPLLAGGIAISLTVLALWKMHSRGFAQKNTGAEQDVPPNA